MSAKAFLVQVELHIQSVTCPGVWLCSNGKVSLQIYMMDSCVQTSSQKSTFPITCNETFTFYKTFNVPHRLSDLQRKLHEQWVYIELVQWQSCEIGNVLASFQTTLDELLYPSMPSGSMAGIDLDLLMEAAKTFPGTIAPKVEVSTRTTIEETVCSCENPNFGTVIVNPKMVLSHQNNKQRNKLCRKVCHSITYSKARPFLKHCKPKPPFRYRKAEENLLLRKPQLGVDPNDEHYYCSCKNNLPRPVPGINFNKKERKQPCIVRMCSCGCNNKEISCTVCAKYKGYFKTNPVSFGHKSNQEASRKPTRSTLFDNSGRSHKSSTNQLCCEDLDEKSVDFGCSDAFLKGCSCLNSVRKPSLAERLHERLTNTLSAMPRIVDWSCGDGVGCCGCPNNSKSRGEMCQDLKGFYGNAYEKNCSLCV